MGIEKIAGNGAMSYQGSAAVQTGPSAAGAVQESSAVVQNAVPLAQAAGSPRQDCARGAKSGEDAENTEELGELGAKQGTQLKSAVNDLNKQMKNSEAIFGIHEKTNRVTIKIVDKSTKEVIKEFPPEQTLDMIAKVWEIAGLMVDEKR